MIEKTKIEIMVALSDKLLCEARKEKDFDIGLVLKLSESMYKLNTVESIPCNPYEERKPYKWASHL